jgi:hypothetical protein
LNRQAFVALVAGAAIVAPRAGTARALGRAKRTVYKRVGILSSVAGDDPGVARLQRAMSAFGWAESDTVEYITRYWGDGELAHLRDITTGLMNEAPDIVVTDVAEAVTAIAGGPHSTSLVYTGAPQGRAPIQAWLPAIASLTSCTGRILVVVDPAHVDVARGVSTLARNNSALTVLYANDRIDFEAAIADVARCRSGIVVVPAKFCDRRHEAALLAAATEHRVPAYFAAAPYTRAAAHVDRLLRAERVRHVAIAPSFVLRSA